MEQYITYNKKEFQDTVERIAHKMYFLNGKISSLEYAGNDTREGKLFRNQNNVKLMGEGIREEFNDICEEMKKFGLNVDFNFKPRYKRTVIVEKI